MALAVPVYTFITLRKGFVRNGYFYTFSEVWTHGIILFLCGTLILATTIVVYISWFNPTFIYDQCQLAITAYQQIGGPIGTEMASSLEMIDEICSNMGSLLLNAANINSALRYTPNNTPSSAPRRSTDLCLKSIIISNQSTKIV